MTSKSEVSRGEAVKVRKILAPDVKMKAQVNARRSAAPDAAQLKAATKSNIEAQRSANAGNRHVLNPGNKPIRSDKPRAVTASGSVRNLRVTAGVEKTKPSAGEARKSHAQLAREKLAAAAARKIRAEQEQAKSALNAQQSRPQQAQTPDPSLNTARQAEAPKPGTQLIQLTPPKRTRARGKFKQEARKQPPIINATALLAAKYPNYFADNNDHRTKAESRTVFVISSMIVALIAFGWINWNAINFQAEGDFSYNSGLIGGITMLVILLYALRKRAKILRKAGNMEAWYYFHLLGGVLGPLIIVFHTGFTIKSINSGVALFTMITIVLSGLFGRYIYTRIGYSLHRKLLAIKESEAQLMEVLHSYDSPMSEKIERRLSNFALSILTGQRSILKLPMRLVAIRGAATTCYVSVANDLTALVKARAARDGLSPHDVKTRLNREKEQLREHIGSVANIANAHLFERILVKWRILHIPLLYILVITALFHVLAVHMY